MARDDTEGSWLLSSSGEGAGLAARLGLPLVAAHHIRPDKTAEMVELYRRDFRSSRWLAHPYVMVSVTTVCADTDERAELPARPAFRFFAEVVSGRGKGEPFCSVAEMAVRDLTEDEQATANLLTRKQTIGGPGRVAERAPVEPGQSLVVLGAAGSTGAAAVQLGKALGATVIAVVGSRAKQDFSPALGADHVLNHRTDDLTARIADITGGRGVDLIFDPVGGDTAATVVKSLVRNGRIAVVGLAGGAPVALDPVDMMLRNYTAIGVIALPDDDPAVEADVWSRLTCLVEEHAIRTAVGTVYKFGEVPRMVGEQSSPPAGKSVVRVSF